MDGRRKVISFLLYISFGWMNGAQAGPCISQSEFDALVNSPAQDVNAAASMPDVPDNLGEIGMFFDKTVVPPKKEFSNTSCPTIDLTPRFRILDKHVYRDQGRLPLCYAYAVADALSYEDNRDYSALSFAIARGQHQYGTTPYTKKDPIRLESIPGTSTSAIVASMNHENAHLCLESELPSDMGRGRDGSTPDALLNSVEDFWVAVHFHKRQLACDRSADIARLFKPLTQKIPDSEKMKEYIRLAQQSMNPISFLYQLNQKACGDRVGVKTDVMIQSWQSSPKVFDTSAAVSAIIAGHPIVIVLSSEFMNTFTGGRNQGHVMVVAGTRMYKGQCEFLVRNSWGQYGSCVSGDPGHCLYGATWMPATLLQDMRVTEEVAEFYPASSAH